MKPSDEGLRCFYKRLWLPFAAPFVLSKLAMLGVADGDVCSLAQREIVLQFRDWPARNCVFHNAADLIEYLQDGIARNRSLPINIHFGPLWAAPHMALQPVWPPRAAKEDGSTTGLDPGYAPNCDLLRPREFERKERADTARGELVLDVDMVCQRRMRIAGLCECGNAPQVCQRCWTAFMLPAQRILTYVVRNFFGFRRCFTAFSGRRGFHLWIADPRVVQWTFHERRAFVARLLAVPHADDALSDFVWTTVVGPCWEEHPDWARTRAEAWALWYPELDAPVADKSHHMHKLPLMLNANTGYFCDILADPDDEQDRFVAAPEQLISLLTMEPEMMLGCVAYLEHVLSE